MKYFLLLFCVSLTINSYSQNYIYNYFDGNGNLPIDFSDNSKSLWQITAPNKGVFNATFSPPNAIMTDSVETYKNNSNASFGITIPRYLFDGAYTISVEWNQKLDIQAGHDGGAMEFSFDDSTWYSVFNNPYIYSFYGYANSNIGYLPDSTLGFTGVDTVWRNIWVCFENWILPPVDSMYFRFRFMSDSIDTGQNGWMIDNIYLHHTYLHTVKKVIENDKNLAVYPNPSNGIVNIRLRKEINIQEIEEIQVIDATAKVVRSFKGLPPNATLDLSDLPRGPYFLQIRTEAGTEAHRIILLPDGQ